MGNIRTIAYTGAESGRKVLPVPLRSPFEKYSGELSSFMPEASKKENLRELSRIESPYSRSKRLCEYLDESRKPWGELLSIASMVKDGDPAGLRLMYAALFVIPPLDVIIADLVDFHHVNRLMKRIKGKERDGLEIEEWEKWFKKKVMLISMSQPLPGDDDVDKADFEVGWQSGVRRALADPDPKWQGAIRERAKTELESWDRRLKYVVTMIDPDIHGRVLLNLKSRLDEVRWRLQVLKVEDDEIKEVLFIKRQLGNRWEIIEEELKESEVGRILFEMFNNQSGKLHSQPNLRTGASLCRAIACHPEFNKGSMVPDLLGILSLFIEHADRRNLEFLVPKGKKFESMINIKGMEIEDNRMIVDLGSVPSDIFVNTDETPSDIDWTEEEISPDVSYRSLILSYIDNEMFLLNLLNNPKAISRPGIISLIALKCRSSRVLSVICNTRSLYTGVNNRDVPLNLVLNPSNIPLNSLRKFIHVRYIDRVTLQKLSRSRGKIREEVRREIDLYLSSR